MKILVLSYFSPPEFSAAASRVFDNARVWAASGHDVTILTSIPNYPKGRVFPGYRYRLTQRETREGVRIVRVASWIASNRTTLGRLCGYLSLTLSQILLNFRAGPADVVIGSSPPLFTAFGAWIVSRLRRVPFIFEVADLWPENLIAVGAAPSGAVIRVLGRIERLLTSRADLVVTVTEGFRDYYVERGVDPAKLKVITNGVELNRFKPAARRDDLARQYGVHGKFVAAYVGTVGLNHGLKTILDAAESVRDDPGIVFLIVGDGADRAMLERDVLLRGLSNVKFAGERPTSEMPEVHALADVLLVLLRDSRYFERVIPSKLFVAMAMGRPVVLGVRGEAAGIVDRAECGFHITPENAQELGESIRRAKQLHARGELEPMGRRGREHVAAHFDRDAKARAYLSLLLSVR